MIEKINKKLENTKEIKAYGLGDLETKKLIISDPINNVSPEDVIKYAEGSLNLINKNGKIETIIKAKINALKGENDIKENIEKNENKKVVHNTNTNKEDSKAATFNPNWTTASTGYNPEKANENKNVDNFPTFKNEKTENGFKEACELYEKHGNEFFLKTMLVYLEKEGYDKEYINNFLKDLEVKVLSEKDEVLNESKIEEIKDEFFGKIAEFIEQIAVKINWDDSKMNFFNSYLKNEDIQKEFEQFKEESEWYMSELMNLYYEENKDKEINQWFLNILHKKFNENGLKEELYKNLKTYNDFEKVGIFGDNFREEYDGLNREKTNLEKVAKDLESKIKEIPEIEINKKIESVYEKNKNLIFDKESFEIDYLNNEKLALEKIKNGSYSLDVKINEYLALREKKQEINKKIEKSKKTGLFSFFGDETKRNLELRRLERELEENNSIFEKLKNKFQSEFGEDFETKLERSKVLKDSFESYSSKITLKNYKKYNEEIRKDIEERYQDAVIPNYLVINGERREINFRKSYQEDLTYKLNLVKEEYKDGRFEEILEKISQLKTYNDIKEIKEEILKWKEGKVNEIDDKENYNSKEKKYERNINFTAEEMDELRQDFDRIRKLVKELDEIQKRLENPSWWYFFKSNKVSYYDEDGKKWKEVEFKRVEEIDEFKERNEINEKYKNYKDKFVVFRIADI